MKCVIENHKVIELQIKDIKDSAEGLKQEFKEYKKRVNLLEQTSFKNSFTIGKILTGLGIIGTVILALTSDFVKKILGI